MPIHTSAPIKVFGQEEFHAIDRVVTGTAFKVHNEYGRYFDERLYQAELAQRFSALGLDVLREMRMTLTLDDFRKDYYADFLLNGGVIVETKTADSLTRAHKAQVLNYYMCGLHHANHPTPPAEFERPFKFLQRCDRPSICDHRFFGFVLGQ